MPRQSAGVAKASRWHKTEVLLSMQEREVVLTKREVEARLVPSGTEIMIPSDTFVTITQSLGGTFTVAVNGNLARIEGHDADALGKQPLESSFETPEDGTVNENQVWEALRNCYDPEIPVNVVDLGLIYDCQIQNGTEDRSEERRVGKGCRARWARRS